ncbi:hypothetical protein HER10_EVM0011447 [Colletotrichum scovillei]|uniref:uncharacterized protein n=1 Tax=Colletotrichum scovillei TaxID=1209932 RepID=UPI0015C392FB|nr:uncharacterized protein HER10_EVM0011447 [Colletotrichum scovillei]KAF4782370.1 hypothetical protein HER10_EVM0011447 [Colletotrichum scovillei]
MSRFVSAGAINAETGEAVTQDATDNTTTTNTNSGGGGTKSAAEAKKSAEWDLVQKELDAERKRREEARVKSVEGGEKSLYDAAFEEANKIRNQFRALDDDEIGFLDEVREAKRAEEERVRRETEEGLVAFRRAQGGETDAAAPVDGGDGGDGEWAVGPRKRRRKERERGFGVKKEKGGEDKVDDKKMEDTADAEKGAVKASSTGAAATATTSTTATAAPVKGKLSLVAYGSDSDDE